MATMREFLIVVDCDTAEELATISNAVSNASTHEIVETDGLTLTIRFASHHISVA